MTEVREVSGQAGDFTVRLLEHPRYVDMDKCIACGECARKCPKKVDDEYNQGLGKRKAIYVKYPQAVPLKYQIDPENCIYLKNRKCGACVQACPAGAIDFNQKPREKTVRVGSMILTPGLKPFDPAGIRTWGYDVFPNVITSLELERYLSVSGPTEGRLARPSDGRPVKRMAFLQCVGSRDLNKAGHGYCSGVCCMYALKEAMIAKDHEPDLDVSIFFVDMRTHGKDFERYYNRAKEAGVKFRRCRVHSLEPAEQNGGVYLRYITDRGKQVGAEYDLVVLSVGLETPPSAAELAGRCKVGLNQNLFAERGGFQPVQAKGRPGMFVSGAFAGPHDIPQSVTEASAAAAAASLPLARVRHSLTREKRFPPERDVRGEEPRVGVFVCHCGNNIAGVIDVEELAAYAAKLPKVAHVERNLFTCSQDTQELLKKTIQEQSLNRIVVAACTPRTHEPLFKETLKASGLNENLLDMANIRNQGSWVHQAEPEKATEKAKDLVRMSVAKVALLTPAPPLTVEVKQSALVVGGGLAGLVSAHGLAEMGYPVHLVELTSRLGGSALHLYQTWRGEPVEGKLDSIIRKVTSHPLITVHLNSKVSGAEGFVGNFLSTIQGPQGETQVEHGVGIMAVGGRAHKPGEYGYGEHRRVFTALEFDKLHTLGDSRVRGGKTFVFIQCVGSREPERPYCSRVCCTHSVQAAIELKEQDPTRKVFILYRDIRTYGQREEVYRRAREAGVVFINYDMHEKPRLRLDNPDMVEVLVWDHVLHEPFRIPTDVLILATAIVPNDLNKELARIYKLPVDADGFLQEAHAKLRPVDFATDGLFLAGLAHYPKPVEETVTQAQAAMARAATVLAKTRIDLDSIKARVIEERCDGCALCVDVCPYHAITLEEVQGEPGRKLVRIEAAKCKGCGCCQATCPKLGVEVAGFTYEQLASQVAAALA
ncbi:heterodisulfide reductase [Desulfocarbo indianensis]|nr:heterodisulfide reductase [Desulfocarbo indianensis]